MSMRAFCCFMLQSLYQRRAGIPSTNSRIPTARHTVIVWSVLDACKQAHKHKRIHKRTHTQSMVYRTDSKTWHMCIYNSTKTGTGRGRVPATATATSTRWLGVQQTTSGSALSSSNQVGLGENFFNNRYIKRHHRYHADENSFPCIYKCTRALVVRQVANLKRL